MPFPLSLPRSLPLCLSTAMALLVPGGVELIAQGVATSAILGTVVAADGSNADDATVRVVNTVTGYVAETHVRDGAFYVQGLEAGGPYLVTVTRLGFRPAQQRVSLGLGEPIRLRIVIQPEALALDTLAVWTAAVAGTGSNVGAGATVGEALIRSLPTPDRDVYDFVLLAPQVSTKVGLQRSGVSAAGSNHRFNSFLVDGADERFISGNVSAAFNIGKSVPLDAVRSYEVLVAPYDVRYGDFAGALINTITRSGTNDVRGTGFLAWRNDRLAPAADLATGSYDRLQYGFALGGPIVRDRAHFFVAPELQRFTAPAPGPHLGQSEAITPQVPVSRADMARLEEILDAHGLRAGSPGPVEISNPLRNLFARVDAALPRLRSRVTATVAYAAAGDQRFSRTAPDTFSLSSYEWTLANGLRTGSLRLNTDLGRVLGGQNEMLLSVSSDWGDFLPAVRQPLVRVIVPGTNGGLVTVNAGTAEQAQGRFARSRSVRVRDDLSVPLGSDHVLRLGGQVERFRVERGGVVGAYGVWTFASLDALEQGVAGRYELRRSFTGPATTMRGWQWGAWVGHEWRASGRTLVTTGVRADAISIDERAPYNPEVDSIFARRTDRMPGAGVHLSPRIGFSWDVSPEAGGRLRGGVGLFTGRPPLAWYVPALSSHGVGVGVLRCGPLPTDQGPPPQFEPDFRAAPTGCATGPGLVTAPRGDVALLAPDLRMARSLRASLAYDRRLPWALLGSVEVLIGRQVSDFMFVNLNLAGPRAVDRFGRVLYGTISEDGLASPALRSEFAEVIELRNTSKNRSSQLSARVERRFERGLAATASYTYSRVRDVQSPSRVNLPGIVLWADARPYSGRHDAIEPGVSLYDIPHRGVGAIAYTAPWGRAPTEISLYYVGESGSPFTYLAGGAGRRGDLNADGSNANDPVYVSRDPFDPDEVRFSGFSDAADADNSAAAQAERVRTQQVAFAGFIRRSGCLRRQRGRILERNSCREPWSHTTVASIRQTVPIGARRVELGLDLYNVLNLLSDAWGKRRVASPRLLEHVGHTAGPEGDTQPIFRFEAGRAEWATHEAESTAQLQITARYSF